MTCFAKFLTKLTESRTADARVQQLSTQLSEKYKLLSERTAELTAVQAFLTKVDAVSEAEVVRLIENMNTLISSASGALSNALDQQTPVPGALTEEPSLGRIRDYFGNLMFEQIAARNSVAVTLAVQMYLVKFVEVVTSGWGDGGACSSYAYTRRKNMEPQWNRKNYIAPIRDVRIWTRSTC